MNIESSCQHVISLVGKKLRDAIKLISSNGSALAYQSKESMKGDNLLSCVGKCAPTLLNFSHRTPGVRSNRSAVIGMCFASKEQKSSAESCSEDYRADSLCLALFQAS